MSAIDPTTKPSVSRGCSFDLNVHDVPWHLQQLILQSSQRPAGRGGCSGAGGFLHMLLLVPPCQTSRCLLSKRSNHYVASWQHFTLAVHTGTHWGRCFVESALLFRWPVSHKTWKDTECGWLVWLLRIVFLSLHLNVFPSLSVHVLSCTLATLSQLQWSTVNTTSWGRCGKGQN